MRESLNVTLKRLLEYDHARSTVPRFAPTGTHGTAVRTCEHTFVLLVVGAPAMIFLIEYNRSKGSIVTFREFDDSQRSEAKDSQLEIELELNRQGVNHEVVLLEAASREALHRTHQRYFVELRQLLISGIGPNI